MPEKRLDLGNGRSAILDSVVLSPADHDIVDWSRLDVGTPVSFTARFIPAKSVFAPIQVKHLKDGPTIVMIGLNGAKPRQPEKAKE